jgi:hypothetical protein
MFKPIVEDETLSTIERLHARSEALFIAVLEALSQIEKAEEIFGESND